MTTFARAVADYMTTPVATIRQDAGLADAEARLTSGPHSCLAVTDEDGRLAGVLSRTDVLRLGRLRATMAQDRNLLTMPHQPVHTRMIREVVTVPPQETLQRAAAAMLQHHIHRVFVVEKGYAIGVLSTRDLMRAVVDARTSEPLSQWMTSPVMTVNVSDTVEEATDRLHSARIRGLVVEDGEWPVGVYTQAEALTAGALDAGTRVEAVMSCAMLCLPSTLPLFRAAAFALQTRARRILVVSARELQGVVSGLDIARAVAAA